ncbi:MAG: SufD family Fe-S cluster assembly protein [Leptospiraceae bacterium]
MSGVAQIQNEAINALKAGTENLPDRSSEQWRKVRLDGVDVFSRKPGEFSFDLAYSKESGVPLNSYSELPSPAKGAQTSYEQAGMKILEPGEGTFGQHWSWLINRARDTRDPFELTTLGYGQPVGLHIQQDIALRIRYEAGQGNLYLPSIYIKVDPDKELDLYIEYSDPNGNSEELGRMWSSTTFIDAGNNARVRIVDSRKHDDLSFHFHRLDVVEGRDSNVHYCAVHRGGLTGKGFVRTRAIEKGAFFRGIGLYTGRSAQLHDMEMEISHEADHCVSTLLYKTVLRDRAHSIFNGSLVAPPHIKQVDSHQTNNNILLSKKARAESMPRLIIQSEDVSCEHGATVGDLDEQALFFLQCRGIPLEEARRILIEGFMEEILSELRMTEEDLASMRDELFPILQS